MNHLKNKLLVFLLITIFGTALNAASISDYVNTSTCDRVIDKQYYKICYSYKYKGPLSGWVKLEGNLVNTNNDIKKRPRFYNEKSLPLQYRTKSKDYTGYGKQWNRGRLLAKKLHYVNSISIAKYDDPDHKIGNDIVIPTRLYRIYFNNDANFEKCFEYKNELNVDYQNDKLKNHEIPCSKLKIN